VTLRLDGFAGLFLYFNQALTKVYLFTYLNCLKLRYFSELWRGNLDLILQRRDIRVLVLQKTKQKLELLLKFAGLRNQRVLVDLRLMIQSLLQNFLGTFQTFQTLHDSLKLVSSDHLL
jgi:hypothetical protein